MLLECIQGITYHQKKKHSHKLWNDTKNITYIDSFLQSV